MPEVDLFIQDVPAGGYYLVSLAHLSPNILYHRTTRSLVAYLLMYSVMSREVVVLSLEFGHQKASQLPPPAVLPLDFLDDVVAAEVVTPKM